MDEQSGESKKNVMGEEIGESEMEEPCSNNFNEYRPISIFGTENLLRVFPIFWHLACKF